MARFSNDVASPHYNGIRLQNNPVDLDAIAQQNNYASFAAWQEADPIGASLAERQNGAQGSYQQAALHDDPDWLKQGLIIGGTVGAGALADWAMAPAAAGAAGGALGVDAAIPSLAAGTVGTIPAGVGTVGTLAGAPIAGGIVSTAPFAGAGGAMAGGAVAPGIASTTPFAGTTLAGAGAGAGGAGAATAGGATAAGAGTAAGATGAGGTAAGAGGTTAAGGGASTAGKILSGAQKAGDILSTIGAGVGGAGKAAAANRGAENLFNIDAGKLDVAGYIASNNAQNDYQNELVARSKLEATARDTEAGNIYRDSVLHNPTNSPYNPRPQTFSPGLIKTYDDLAEQGSTDLAQRPVYDPRTMTAPQYSPYNRPLPVFKQPGTLEQAGNWIGPTLSTVGSILAKR